MPAETSCCTLMVYIIIFLGWIMGAVVALTYLLSDTDVHGLFVLVIMSVMFICGATYWYIYRERGGEAELHDQDSVEGEEAAGREERPPSALEDQQPEDAPPPYEDVILLPPSYDQLYGNDLIAPNDLTKAKSSDRLSCRPDVVPES
ncbi:uncharacterized protein LOC122256156 [Penaeus japonicus]|uniref:uncharacterized protein LOC122256156 n=1 Tax=Penaeus japonicus TaxID=27405 RepID=UPI001C70EAE6|nr:uncharacterized protein LOC122256156 [Penaeus japonicus]